MPGQTCPRCSVSVISARTGKCELCGFVPGSAVAVAGEDPVMAAAARELAHEFDFGELLGQGKGSAVYRVREKNGARAAILKVTARRPDVPDGEEGFRSMLGMFVGFEHPHLVPVHRYGSTDSLFWYTTEDLGATSLKALLDERGALDARTCRRLATQIVAALDYLHRHGVVHGALKVENVLLDKEGWVRLCDASFMRPRWKRRSRSVPPRGTPALGGREGSARPSWVAPEDHERGERLPAADQYALAALLYECLTGEMPADPPRPLLDVAPNVPAQMARAIDTGLSPEPFRRFASCAELVFALETGTPTAAMAAILPTTPAPRPRERVTQDVVMIRGWEPPELGPRRLLPIVGRVAGALVVAAALWWSAPTLRRILFPPTGPSVAAPALSLPSSGQRPDPVTAREPRAEAAATTAPRVTPRIEAPRPVAPTRPAAAAPSPAPASAAPAPSAVPARLFVNATPWGVLYVDGQLIGNTPKANLEVEPGQRTIRVVRQGFETFERAVQLAPGEVLRLTDIVLAPTRP